MKQEFIKIYTENIHRGGSADLLAWLERCDFFAAPASSKFHLCREGGLCEHSVNVFNRLVLEFSANIGDARSHTETLAICGLLHDICKANFYTVSTRNVKNEATGQWEKQPFYAIEEKFPFGHGEKSVFLIERFMKLTIEEAVAIRFHMGCSDAGARDYSTPAAFRKYPLALALYIADLQATFIDESEDK